MVEKVCFSAEEISACTTKEELAAVLRRASSRKVLYEVFREYGLSFSGLEFCTKEKLAEYLAGELLLLQKKKPLRQSVSLIDRLAEALMRKSEEMVLSFSGATLAGMMVFMLAI